MKSFWPTVHFNKFYFVNAAMFAAKKSFLEGGSTVPATPLVADLEIIHYGNSAYEMS
jgi:hypothetical protein